MRLRLALRTPARARLRALSVAVALAASLVAPPPFGVASARTPGSLFVEDADGNRPPVVNLGGHLDLRVVDGAGAAVAGATWTSDSPEVGAVSASGRLDGVATGFAYLTARVGERTASAFAVVVKVGRRGGARTSGDTKADASRRVYLASPREHVVFRASGSTEAELFAGSRGEPDYANGVGANARFRTPTGLGVDNRADGGVYVADTDNDCVRKVSFEGDAELAFGSPGDPGMMTADETPIGLARFDGPRGIATSDDVVYVADTKNACIYTVDRQAGTVRVLAGTPGSPGLHDGRGRDAQFDHPAGLALNPAGTVLAVADTKNGRVRLVRLARDADGRVVGDVTTLGEGSSARGVSMAATWKTDRAEDAIAFDDPSSVSFDAQENVYVIDARTASVVTRTPTAVERVNLAQPGSLGDPASVYVSGTRALVVDEAAERASEAIVEAEVGGPTIDAVSPGGGGLRGATVVTVTGANFSPETRVTLGDEEVADVRVDGARRLTFTAPAQRAPGSRTLTVTTRGGVAQFPFEITATPLSELKPGYVTTAAGGVPYLGEGGPAVSASASLAIEGMAIDGAGNLYLTDARHHRVRRVDANTRALSSVAGSGNSGVQNDDELGDGGPALTALMAFPAGVAVDGAGDVYVSDLAIWRVRRIDHVTGVITTVAGGRNGREDGMPATSVGLGRANDIALDSHGNLYLIEDGDRISRVDAATGVITTYVGDPDRSSYGDGRPALETRIDGCTAIEIDRDDNLYFSTNSSESKSGRRVRRVDAATTIVTSVAGSADADVRDGVRATESALAEPIDLAVDGGGDVFVVTRADRRVRRVDARTGIISTVLGGGSELEGRENDLARSSNVFSPRFVVVDGSGSLLVGTDEEASRRVWRVDGTTNRLSLYAGDPLPGSEPAGVRSSPSLGPMWGVRPDRHGGILVCDVDNNLVRRLDPKTGALTTVAGGGRPTYDARPRRATDSWLYRPRSAVEDPSGNVYIASTGTGSVYRVDPGGTMSLFAGGLFDPDGYYGAWSIAVDDDGFLYVAQGSRIFRFAPDGTRSLYAGTGSFGFSGDGGPATSARIGVADAMRLAIGGDGSLYFADYWHLRIRRVDRDTGIITTVAGNGQVYGDPVSGPATDVPLNYVADIAFDPAGNLWIVNGGTYLQRVDRRTGRITTKRRPAGAGYEGDGGPFGRCDITSTWGMAFDDDGNLYIGDTANTAIRVIREPERLPKGLPENR